MSNKITINTIYGLFKKFSIFYNHAWLSICSNAKEWEDYASVWLKELENFDLQTLFKAQDEAVNIYTDFPPNLGQIKKLCIKYLGVPSQDEIMNLMIRRDFTHPIVEACYKRIGSWAAKNDTATILQKKIKEVYAEELQKLINPRLEFNEQVIERSHGGLLHVSQHYAGIDYSRRDLGEKAIDSLLSQH